MGKVTPAELAELDQQEARLREILPFVRGCWQSMTEEERMGVVAALLREFDRDFVAMIIGVANAEE